MTATSSRAGGWPRRRTELGRRSRPWLAPAAIALLAAGGCGGAAGAGAGPAAHAAFGWLKAQSPPAGWRSAQTPRGATLAYPAGWKRVKGDRGTVSAASLDAQGRFLGYLNLTPRQGVERQAGWAAFRVRHNLAEGNRDERVLAAAEGLPFKAATGACVQDSYVTVSGAAYMELACLVGGHHPSVVVGAAPPSAWRAQAAAIERAIAAVRT